MDVMAGNDAKHLNYLHVNTIFGKWKLIKLKLSH